MKTTNPAHMIRTFRLVTAGGTVRSAKSFIGTAAEISSAMQKWHAYVSVLYPRCELAITDQPIRAPRHAIPAGDCLRSCYHCGRQFMSTTDVVVLHPGHEHLAFCERCAETVAVDA